MQFSLPSKGVSRDPKGQSLSLLIVDEEGKVEQRMITVDRAIGDKWLVSSGLAAGDKLIVEGIQKVRPGIPVKAVPFDTGNKEAQSAAKTVPPPAKAK